MQQTSFQWFDALLPEICFGHRYLRLHWPCHAQDARGVRHTLLSKLKEGSLLQVEQIGIEEESLALLGSIGEAASLRHAVQLLTPAQVLGVLLRF